MKDFTNIPYYISIWTETQNGVGLKNKPLKNNEIWWVLYFINRIPIKRENVKS